MDLESILSKKNTVSLSDKELEFLVEHNYKVTDASPDRIKSDLHALSKLDTSELDLTDQLIINTIKKTKDKKILAAFYVKCLDDDPSNARTIDVLRTNYSVIITLMDLFNDITAGGSYAELAAKGGTGDVFRRAIAHIEAAYTRLTPVDRQSIVKFLKSSGMLFDELPNAILTSDTYIAYHLRKKDDSLHKITFDALNCLQYDKELEQDFLVAVESTGTTIEEYLASQLLHSTDDDILQISAVKLYVLKLLDQFGVQDVRVNVNTYGYSADTQGSCFQDRIDLHCYSNRSLEKMIHTGAHEAHHADQNKNVKYVLLTKDNDIDIYSKEDFIRDIDPSYYPRNYRKVASEYDADLKAKIDLFKLKDLQVTPFERLRKVITVKLFREKDYLKDIKSHMQYEMVSTRLDENNVEHPLETIFEATLKKAHSESLENGTFHKLMTKIRTNYPIIEFEYSITESDVHRRSVRELVDKMIEDKNNVDVYRYLLISYLNPKKNMNALFNRHELEELQQDSSLPVGIRVYIKECLENEAMDKYYTRAYERTA